MAIDCTHDFCRNYYECQRPQPAADSRDPDHTRSGIFVYHNCYKCKDGKLPCVARVPGNCGYPRARND